MFRGRPRLPLFGLAVLISALIVLLGNAATNLVLGQPIFLDGAFGSIDAPDVALLNFLFTGAPLLLLALRGVRRIAPWALAIVLSAAFWSYYVWRIWRASLVNFEGGADIGLGLIMLASPLVIILALLAWRALEKLAQGSDLRRNEPWIGSSANE